ncbi:hypothetical protein XCY_001426 [Xanthomonas euroxanthea]|nr:MULTISPECIES: hypothetical protein [Xanthomonas]CAG2087507.1 hypothetical protein XCY_001426 [Xanthomonas euroxanthea]
METLLDETAGVGGRWKSVLQEVTPIKKPASADAGSLIPGRLVDVA